ncbi:hypothetical protein K1719_032568 [Acacia pycnantha]|nr:hypothetical protein K1719_032568 [Acacia pycnantha]
MAEHTQKGPLLQFAPMQSLVDEGFWHRLSSLKLNKLGIDDSPIPINGFCAPCSHSQISNHLTLLAESLPCESSESLLAPDTSRGNRNKCSVPGILYNTNTVESFHALDKQNLLKAEASKIWEDIQTGKAVEDPAILSRFLLISFADLKKWTFHYCFSVVEQRRGRILSTACNEWRNSRSTADVPFFFITIDANSCATIKHLKDWETCQSDAYKTLFGFMIHVIFQIILAGLYATS